MTGTKPKPGSQLAGRRFALIDAEALTALRSCVRLRMAQGARRRSCPPPFGLLLYLAMACALRLVLGMFVFAGLSECIFLSIWKL